MMTSTPPVHQNIPAMQLARTPMKTRQIAWLVLFILVGCIPILLLAPWTQTAHGIGKAIAFNPVQRPQFIISPIEGRIRKWHVMEGDKVVEGQLLVELVDNDPFILERLQHQQTLAMERLTLADGRVANQVSRLQFVKDEREILLAEAGYRIEQAEAQILVVKQELQQAIFNLKREELAYDRLYRLYTSKVGEVVSKDQVEEAERKRDLAKEQVPLVEARIKLAEKTLSGAMAQRDAMDKRTSGLIESEEGALKLSQSEQASVNQQLNIIKTQVDRQLNQTVYASKTGTIYRILANAEAGGQLVRPGERLAVLVPDIKSEQNPDNGLTGESYPGIVTELYIDGNDLPLVRVGDRAILQFEGWAAVQFASYPEAAAGTFEGRVYLIDPTAEDQGKFRILVEPAPGAEWPDEAFLRQGVRAQGWVLIGEVRLGYEIWRLLNGFPPAREVSTKQSRAFLGPVNRK